MARRRSTMSRLPRRQTCTIIPFSTIRDHALSDGLQKQLCVSRSQQCPLPLSSLTPQFLATSPQNYVLQAGPPQKRVAPHIKRPHTATWGIANENTSDHHVGFTLTIPIGIQFILVPLQTTQAPFCRPPVSLPNICERHCWYVTSKITPVFVIQRILLGFYTKQHQTPINLTLLLRSQIL